jgi:hypothetical protein
MATSQLFLCPTCRSASFVFPGYFVEAQQRWLKATRSLTTRYNKIVIKMPYHLFDYVGSNGTNEIKVWTENLQRAQLAKLNARLDMLSIHGHELFPDILTGSPTAGILKLRCRGNVQLRPLLCDGPINIGNEYTLLVGAIEKGDRFMPPKADLTANKNKNAVIGDHKARRQKHERIS